MRVYSKMKEMLYQNKDILLPLEKLKRSTNKSEDDIQIIFAHLKKLIQQPVPATKTTRIGFKKDW